MVRWWRWGRGAGGYKAEWVVMVPWWWGSSDDERWWPCGTGAGVRVCVHGGEVDGNGRYGLVKMLQ